jgi:signal transduction histidine kinase
VHDAVNIVRPAADAKQILIEESLDPSVPRLSVDAARIQQVVLNLLNNAIKFSPEGARVIVRLERTVGGVQIQVTDSGQGIAPDFLPHIFTRFRPSGKRLRAPAWRAGPRSCDRPRIGRIAQRQHRAESPGVGKGRDVCR